MLLLLPDASGRLGKQSSTGAGYYLPRHPCCVTRYRHSRGNHRLLDRRSPRRASIRGAPVLRFSMETRNESPVANHDGKKVGGGMRMAPRRQLTRSRRGETCRSSWSQLRAAHKRGSVDALSVRLGHRSRPLRSVCFMHTSHPPSQLAASAKRDSVRRSIDHPVGTTYLRCSVVFNARLDPTQWAVKHASFGPHRSLLSGSVLQLVGDEQPHVVPNLTCLCDIALQLRSAARMTAALWCVASKLCASL